jgi:hypothetical protein
MDEKENLNPRTSKSHVLVRLSQLICRSTQIPTVSERGTAFKK